MSKSTEEIRKALRENEERINRHLEGLRQEVTGGKGVIKDAITDKPFLGIGGALLIGVITGLILGKKSTKAVESEWLDDQMEKIGHLAREVGASPETLSLLLKDALKDNQAKSLPTNASRGILGSILGLASDVAIGFAKNSMLSFLQNSLLQSQAGFNERKDEEQGSTE